MARTPRTRTTRKAGDRVHVEAVGDGRIGILPLPDGWWTMALRPSAGTYGMTGPYATREAAIAAAEALTR